MLSPVVVLPIFDPQKIFIPHLVKITPLLKSVFIKAFINLPTITRKEQPDAISFFTEDTFFVCSEFSETPVGEHFRNLYAFSASICSPEQVLHLCYIDRLAFALETQFCQVFTTDIQTTTADQTPLIYQRSPSAWESHPQNYREIEGMVTTTGEWLFQKSIDFAWCHLAIQAGLLAEVMKRTQQSDLSLVAEMILQILDQVKTKEVNWLAWEDPFIYNLDPQGLKLDRESDPSETRKRLAYALPMMHLLHAYSRQANQP